MYATIEDLTEYLSPATTLPDDIDRLLQRASELIDFKTYGKAAEDPETACRATCAQIEYWLQIDECNDITGPLGAVSLDGFSMESRFATLAPRAQRYLQTANLIYSGVGIR